MAVDVEALQTDADNLQNVIKNIHEYLVGVNTSISNMSGKIQDIMMQDSINKYNKQLEQVISQTDEVSKILGEGNGSIEKGLTALNKSIKSLGNSKRDLNKIINGGTALVDRIDALGNMKEQIEALDKMTVDLAKIEELREFLNQLKESMDKVFETSLSLHQSADNVSNVSDELQGINQSIVDNIEAYKEHSKQSVEDFAGLKDNVAQWIADIEQAEQDIKKHIEEELAGVGSKIAENDEYIAKINDALDLTANQQVAVSGFLLEIKATVGDLNEKIGTNIADMKIFAERVGMVLKTSINQLEESANALNEQLNASGDKVITALGDFSDKYQGISEDVTALKELLQQESIVERQEKVETSMAELLEAQKAQHSEQHDAITKIQEQQEKYINSAEGLTNKLEETINAQNSAGEQLSEKVNNVLEQQTEVTNQQSELGFKQIELTNKVEEVSSKVVDLMTIQEGLVDKYDELNTNQQKLIDAQNSITDGNKEVLEQIQSIIAEQSAINSQIKETQLETMDVINNVMNAQRELKAQQRTILEAQQQQLNKIMELQKKNTSTKKANILMNAGVGALVAAVVMAASIGIYTLTGGHIGSSDNSIQISTEAADDGEDVSRK